MYESILTSIKRLLGIEEEEDSFDFEIVMHINSFLMTLNQIGVGVNGFTIEDESSTWDEFLLEDQANLQAVKTYIFLSVKSVFDPSANGTVAQSYEKKADELLWRLRLAAEEARKEV